MFIQGLGEPGEALREKMPSSPVGRAPSCWKNVIYPWLYVETYLPLSSLPQARKHRSGLTLVEKEMPQRKKIQSPSGLKKN